MVIEPMAIIGMIFSLIVLGMIGGFILLFPLSRQITTLLHRRLERGEKPMPDEQLEGLVQVVEALRAEVERLSDRQDFTERLLERPRDTPEG